MPGSINETRQRQRRVNWIKIASSIELWYFTGRDL